MNLNGIRIDLVQTTVVWHGQSTLYTILTLEYNLQAIPLGFSGVNDTNDYHSHYKYNFTYLWDFFNDEFWNIESFPTKNDNIQELSFGLNIGFSGAGLDQVVGKDLNQILW